MYSTTWMDLQRIMLSEKANYKRLHTVLLHLHSILEIKQNYGDEEEINGFQRLGMRWGYTL